MKILVVDDSIMVRKLIKDELEQGGYEVVEAVNGIEALIKATVSKPPDLITLDIEMPKLNGFDTYKKFHEKHYARFFSHKKDNIVPVIFVTSNDNLEERKKGFQLGAADFITKPFEAGDILLAVDNILKPENRLQGLTAMIVDDSKLARRIVSDILLREGLTLIEAEDGMQAFEIMCNKMAEIDIVITDLFMPKMDGKDLCKKIRNELNMPELPIILLTALSDRTELLGVFKAGATDYLVKPFVKEELLARITVQLQRTYLNKRLRKTVNKLKTLSKVKDNLLAVCSHDLRSPLSGILGFTDLLLEKDYIEAGDKEGLKQIKSSGDILLGLINDILDLSKIEAEQTELPMEAVSMSEIAQTSINALQYLSIHKSQRLEMNNKCFNDVISGNRNSLIRVINNLLSNAVKFTPEGGVIELIIESGNLDNLVVKIVDSGIGIAEDKIPHLFEVFTKTSQSGTKGEKGTGLGLSIIKKIVEKHGGRVEVSSKLGQGSCFKLIFPQLDGLPQKMPANKTKTITKKPKSEIRKQSCKILLVEDNPVNIMLAKKMLAKTNHKITVAENGRLAVEKAKSDIFDVIFMDLQMPEMNGIEATKQIRKLSSVGKNVPIVALTADVSQKSVDSCIASGMNDFLAKPFKADELKAKIEKWRN